MRRYARLSMLVGLLVLFVVASVTADQGDSCPVLAADVQFVDLSGNTVDLATADAIALREVDNGAVLVYGRTSADAEALVRALAADGERNPELLDADAWLVAQVGGCQSRAGNKCGGTCPGRQTCKRVKKPGRDACTCVR